MLSETYEIEDMKKELEAFQTYGYDNESKFQEDLEYAIDIAKLERMEPVIGEDTYDALEALDKTGLSTTELYVYRAEVYFSIAEFYLLHGRRDKYRRRAARESRTQGDVTFSTLGTIGKEMAANDYIEKAKWSLAEGGYDFQQGARLQRRVSIHGS